MFFFQFFWSCRQVHELDNLGRVIADALLSSPAAPVDAMPG